MLPSRPPRSILKCPSPIPSSASLSASSSSSSISSLASSSTVIPHHPHGCVRFPSSPKLSTVHLTHCSTSYDRTPIVVLPNTCAMPERNCRSYSAQGSPLSTQGFQQSRHLHPSVMFGRGANSNNNNNINNVNNNGHAHGHGVTNASHHQYTLNDTYDGGLYPPPLTQDDGSSEESDGIASPPPETICINALYRQYVPSQAHLHSDPLSHPPIPRSSDVGNPHLPHHHRYAASLAPSSSAYGIVPNDDHHVAVTPSEYSMSFLPHAPPPTSCRKKTRVHAREPKPVSVASSGSNWCESEESSCLGGF